MASKASKKRAKIASRKIATQEGKSGRPRREGAPRRADGKIDYRAMESEAKAKATVMEARRRKYGGMAIETDDPRAGYSLGRFCLRDNGGVQCRDVQSSALLDAGNRMHADYERYYAVTGIPSPSPRAQDLTRVRGLSGKDRQDEARAATNRIMQIETAIGVVDSQGRPVMQLIKRLILADEDTRGWTPQMIAHVKRGLKALVKHYGLDEVAVAQ